MKIVLIAARRNNRPVDNLDHQIIACLLDDGRASYATIARAVGLSLPATKRRVDRLVAAQVIRGFTALVDPQAIGGGLQAIIQVFTRGTVSYPRMRKDLETVPEVIEAVTVTGPADAMVRVVAGDAEHLERVITRLRSLEYVRQTDTTRVLSTLVRRAARDLRTDSEQ
jgi:DNA-binding Lrp family transcriptional regulator